MSSARVIIVGAGVFGLTAALEIKRRGHEVLLLDQGAIPHPLAASTDISKVVRMEYGADATYMALAEAAIAGWRHWNEHWQRSGNSELYHETGVLMMSLDEMAPGGFEYESFHLLEARGHQPERLGGAELADRFPAWTLAFSDGFFHPRGGFVESGRVIETLAEVAREQGIEVRENTALESLLETGDRVLGVRDAHGDCHEGDHVILATGSWTPRLFGRLEGALRRTYHPVWHLSPPRHSMPALFAPLSFPTFTADVARTGFYGFPLHPRAGVIKIGHHGSGLEPPEDGSLEVSPEATVQLRAFLDRYFPSLAAAEVVGTRLCPYCDTTDEDFWIANDPDRRGLTVASGGSGHGFKFAPILGRVIADVADVSDVADDAETREVEQATNASALMTQSLADKFRWRPELRLDRGLEAARCHESVTRDMNSSPGDRRPPHVAR
ncbi:MAG: FAD-dependent oxidoreductase [Acidobacteriota bacterium]|nr:FAD-dependent oxidoreductase [Acidobacteriota bacterium]